MSVFLISFLLSLSFAPALFGEEGPPCAGVEACFQRAVEHLEKKDLLASQSLLEDLWGRDSGSLWGDRSAFLLGKVRLETGSGDPRSPLLHAFLTLPVLRDYILFSLGVNSFQRGDLLRAVRFFDLLVRSDPESLLLPQAIYKGGEAYFSMGEYERARERFQRFLTLFPSSPLAPVALLEIARSYVEEKKKEEGAFALLQLWVRYPDTSWAGDAERMLRDLGVVPGPEERLKRGRNLLVAGKDGRAIEELSRLLEEGLPPSLHREAHLILGEAQFQGKRIQEAKKSIEVVLSPSDKEALVLWGKIASRLGDEKGLLLAIEHLPSSLKERTRLLLNVARLFEERKEYGLALDFYRKAHDEDPQGPLAEEALWSIGWIFYKTGDLDGARKTFDTFLSLYPKSPLFPQVLYWRGRTFERQGSLPKAGDDFHRVCAEFPFTYYCHIAQKRIKMNLPVEEAFLPVEDESVPGDIHYQKAQELKVMGLKEEAISELVAAGRSSQKRQVLLAINEELSLLEGYSHSVRQTILFFRDILEKGRFSWRLWRVAYPLGILPRITRYLGGKEIDPYLVAAIMREESLFDPNAVSRSGAIGLMQVMPRTGEWVASRIGMENFSSDLLFDSEINIQVGTWYLVHLYERFDKNPFLTVAAYNAGPEAVSQWQVSGEFQEMDEFVEGIPYTETRWYVKRVMRSYNEYRRIGTIPSPRASLTRGD